MTFKYYKPERLTIFIIALTVIFGAIATLVHHSITDLPAPVKNLIFFTDSFTVPFFIALIMHLINKKLWKSKQFKWLIDIPNLNGRYLGTIVSSYSPPGGSPVVLDCVLEIKQSATSLHITAYFGTISTGFISSSSFSVSEELVPGKNGFFTLYYIFTNETGGISQKLNNHSGTAKYSYYPDKHKLEGVYYNVLGNKGEIKVSLEQTNLLGRLIP